MTSMYKQIKTIFNVSVLLWMQSTTLTMDNMSRPTMPSNTLDLKTIKERYPLVYTFSNTIQNILHDTQHDSAQLVDCALPEYVDQYIPYIDQLLKNPAEQHTAKLTNNGKLPLNNALNALHAYNFLDPQKEKPFCSLYSYLIQQIAALMSKRKVIRKIIYPSCNTSSRIKEKTFALFKNLPEQCIKDILSTKGGPLIPEPQYRLIEKSDSPYGFYPFDFTYSPDGLNIASVNYGAIPASSILQHPYIDLFSSEKQTLIATKEFYLSQAPSGLSYSPCGNFLSSGHKEGIINIWNSCDGKLVKTLATNEGNIEAIEYNPTHKGIIVGTQRGRIMIWQQESLESGTLESITNNFYTKIIAISPSGSHIASAGLSSKIIIWDMDTNTPCFSLTNQNAQWNVEHIAYNRTHNLLLSTYGTSDLTIWDPATQQPIKKVINQTHNGIASFDSHDYYLAFSCNSKKGASVQLWDIRIDKQISTFNISESKRPPFVKFKPNGTEIACTGHDKITFFLWT